MKESTVPPLRVGHLFPRKCVYTYILGMSLYTPFSVGEGGSILPALGGVWVFFSGAMDEGGDTQSLAMGDARNGRMALR